MSWASDLLPRERRSYTCPSAKNLISATLHAIKKKMRAAKMLHKTWMQNLSILANSTTAWTCLDSRCKQVQGKGQPVMMLELLQIIANARSRSWGWIWHRLSIRQPSSQTPQKWKNRKNWYRTWMIRVLRHKQIRSLACLYNQSPNSIWAAKLMKSTRRGSRKSKMEHKIWQRSNLQSYPKSLKEK